MSTSEPDIIFIIPYRDREKELEIFRQGMEYIKEIYKNKVQFMIIHQCDSRPFNRGAMKNIGFKVVKDLYPSKYTNITLVFNDVDIVPTSSHKIDYETISGTVKHFYGYTHTLGGIISINAGDFENINGFPNFWTWGYEDKVLQKRIEKKNISIDRSNFLEITQKEEHIVSEKFILSPGTNTRIVSKKEVLYAKYNILIGISHLNNVKYTICKNNFINVTEFQTSNKIPDNQKTYVRGNMHNIRKVLGLPRNPSMKMF